jgi:hypothetical protein
MTLNTDRVISNITAVHAAQSVAPERSIPGFGVGLSERCTRSPVTSELWGTIPGRTLSSCDGEGDSLWQYMFLHALGSMIKTTQSVNSEVAENYEWWYFGHHLYRCISAPAPPPSIAYQMIDVYWFSIHVGLSIKQHVAQNLLDTMTSRWPVYTLYQEYINQSGVGYQILPS